MRKLIFIWVMLLVAGAATAQDLITTKKKVAVVCTVEDVKGYNIVFRTGPGAPLVELNMNTLQSVYIADSAKRKGFEDRSPALRALTGAVTDSSAMVHNPQDQTKLARLLLQSGGNQISKGALQLVTGNIIGLSAVIISSVPSLSNRPAMRPLIIIGSTLGLIFNISGLYNISEGGKDISAGASAVQ